VPEGFAPAVVAAPGPVAAFVPLGAQPDSEKEPTAGAPGRHPGPIVETLELEDLLAEHVEIPTGTLAVGSGWRLRIVGGPNPGRLYSLKGNEMLIGRDSARCQVHLGESMVSRQHAVLLAEGKAWRVKRLSTNAPLYVNGEAIDEQLLKPGDQIQIGSTLFVAEGL
jgi:hypothetical protein